MRRAAIVVREIDPRALIDEVRSPRFGATAMFVGTVREVNEGRSVISIEYSAYVSMAEAEMEQILVEAEERFGPGAVVVEHRVGPLAVGDVSIAIAAAHGHRRPAMDAMRFVIEEVKSRVPIWKLERYLDGGSHWADPTEAAEGARR